MYRANLHSTASFDKTSPEYTLHRLLGRKINQIDVYLIAKVSKVLFYEKGRKKEHCFFLATTCRASPILTYLLYEGASPMGGSILLAFYLSIHLQGVH